MTYKTIEISGNDASGPEVGVNIQDNVLNLNIGMWRCPTLEERALFKGILYLSQIKLKIKQPLKKEGRGHKVVHQQLMPNRKNI